MADYRDENERLSSGLYVANYSRQGNRSVRRVIVPWADRTRVNQDILGYTVRSDDDELDRYLPWFDPDDRDVTIGRAAVRTQLTGLSPRPAPDDDELDVDADPIPMQAGNAYELAEITIYFETVRHTFGTFDDATTSQLGALPDVEQNRYVVKRIQPGRELINATPGTYCWAERASNPAVRNDALKVNYPIPTVIPHQEIDVTWLDIPIDCVPFTAITASLGRVNSEEIDIPGPGDLTYAPETLLLNSLGVEEIYFPDSTLAYNLTYHFLYRNLRSSADPDDVGWNIRRHPDGTFRRVFRKGTSDGIYETAEAQDLFTVEP